MKIETKSNKKNKQYILLRREDSRNFDMSYMLTNTESFKLAEKMESVTAASILSS